MYLLSRDAASDKGKYVAMVVLLPQVGALRLINLCPSIVEQLVWAVGIRGNVSGQATSLLLQVLELLKQEVRHLSCSLQYSVQDIPRLVCMSRSHVVRVCPTH